MTARQDLRAVAKEKARHPAALPNVLLGGQVAVRVGSFFLGGGLKPPRVFLSKVSAAGQRGGYGVWGGAWEWPVLSGRIHQRPIELSDEAKEPPFLLRICQVYSSK